MANALSHKNTLLSTRLSVVKEQFRGIQTLFEHVLHAYKSLSRCYPGPPVPHDETRLPIVRKLVSQKDLSRMQNRRASIMAFRFQAFQRQSVTHKSSFVVGERPMSQNVSINDDRNAGTLNSKTLDKLLRAMKTGDDDEAEVIQRRCEEIEACIAEIETRIYTSHKAEMTRWSQFLSHLKDNYESELTKRHDDIKQLNGALSSWVRKFLDLQEVLQPRGHERCYTVGEDVLRILERTQQLAVDSIRDRSRLSCGSWIGAPESLDRHSGDFGEIDFLDEDDEDEGEGQ